MLLKLLTIILVTVSVQACACHSAAKGAGFGGLTYLGSGSPEMAITDAIVTAALEAGTCEAARAP